MGEAIPDLNLFMVCKKLEEGALSPVPPGYHLRLCRRSELPIWKTIHFDEERTAREMDGFMSEYFSQVYDERFFQKCLFLCEEPDIPVGTCFIWKAYGEANTLHWFKILKSREGKGLGRALLSQVMQGLGEADYPVYLHTQPSSYRAIKLYTDFGFAFITDREIGYRENGLEESLPVLKRMMPAEEYRRLRFTRAGEAFLRAAKSSRINQF